MGAIQNFFQLHIFLKKSSEYSRFEYQSIYYYYLMKSKRINVLLWQKKIIKMLVETDFPLFIIHTVPFTPPLIIKRSCDSLEIQALLIFDFISNFDKNWWLLLWKKKCWNYFILGESTKNVRHGFCIIKTSILFELVTKKNKKKPL